MRAGEGYSFEVHWDDFLTTYTYTVVRSSWITEYYKQPHMAWAPDFLFPAKAPGPKDLGEATLVLEFSPPAPGYLPYKNYSLGHTSAPQR